LDKEQFQKAVLFGAPLVDTMVIRIPRRLGVFIKTCALIENTDPSKVARRLMTLQAVQEGFDPNGG